MKNTISKIIAVVLTLCMALSLAAVSAFAADNELTAVVSLEGLTIGQGMYIAPKAYTLGEINTIVASEGYGPYTEKNLTAAIATLAAFLDNGIDVSEIKGWTGGLYISDIKGIDKGTVNIPAAITAASGISNENNLGNDDEYLGGFDYSTYGGWMYTVNGDSPWVGADGYVFSEYDAVKDNTYVVRWQFTVYGWGVDIGGDTWGMFNEVGDFADMNDLYIAYASSQYPAAKAEAEKVICSYLPTQADVDAMTAYVENYSCSHLCHSDNGFLQFVWKLINFFNKLIGMNGTCVCGQAHYSLAK